MPLPTRTSKYYPTKIASTGKDVTYCKMNLRQQKTILMLEAEENKEIRQQKALINVMNDCIEGCDVNNLYKTDFQKLVYDIRSSSDGNMLKFTYNNVKFEKNKKLYNYDDIVNTTNMIGIEDDKRMEHIRTLLSKYERIIHTNTYDLDIKNDIELTKGVFEKDIVLDKWKVHLKAPSIRMLQYIDERECSNEEKELYRRMVCLEYIADETQVYNDFTFDEMTKFFDENINSEEFEIINEFYEQIPKLVLKKEFKCEKWNDVLLPKGKEISDFL